MDVLFENKKRTDVLKNYLYTNHLTESEIDVRLKEFLNYGYMKGLSHGIVVLKNTNRRILNSIRRKREKIFHGIINELNDEMLSK